MSKTTLEEQSNDLAKIRGWIARALENAPSKEIQDALFEAQQAVGFSLLHLERVEYLTREGSKRAPLEPFEKSSFWQSPLWQSPLWSQPQTDA